ncbi:diguanylate cyclase [Novosphingobium sp. BW1]|uniref:diguanylate cyclase n=1 Tax=Novosphingobium sp. BW1 TaxID=2592621 RepID=UPI0011DEF67E|nr:diguanylate cyclase [Novosphingobium sp. BW1]TYC90703.1 diguanylate cyclase [Novosphingobium sp. BW1]
MSQVTPRSLTLRYVVALGLIALLSIVSHFVLTETLRANEGGAAIINMSGRQRMLSQRISALADDLHRGDEEVREPLVTAVRQFADAHRVLAGLASRQEGATVAERRLYDIYYGPGEIDRLARRFLDAAEAEVALPQEGHGPAAADEIGNLRNLSILSRGPLLAGLEEVVAIHQSVSEVRAQQMERIQWGILAIVLLTLAFEVLFIFRPMVRRISEYVGQLLDLADHDYLTGVLNRRAFTALAEAEIQRARRHDRPMSLLLLDVDRFKQVNDFHGHLAGDEVLCGVAQILDMQGRREDLVGRIGGEEFAILLPETSLAGAIDVADRVRETVAGEPFMAAGKALSITLSVGVTEVDRTSPCGVVTAMARADQMLYHAKSAGRNCVRPFRGSILPIRNAAKRSEPVLADSRVLGASGEGIG